MEKPFYLIDQVNEAGKTAQKKVLLEEVIDMNKDVWKTKDGVNIISYLGIKKIMRKEGIVKKDFEFGKINPSTENHQLVVCSVWVGYKNDKDIDNWAHAIGEASMLNTGIVQTPEGIKHDGSKIDSKYKMCMAYKRAIVTAVIDLIQLDTSSRIYCETDAPEFKFDPASSKPFISDYNKL